VDRSRTECASVLDEIAVVYDATNVDTLARIGIGGIGSSPDGSWHLSIMSFFLSSLL
jgi:hypothetical protein